MISSAILGLSSLLTIYVFLRFLLSYTHRETEPPTVATEIPFLSPMIGMAKTAKFYIELRWVSCDWARDLLLGSVSPSDKYNLPIYTLRLPGSRIYVINSINLIPAVERQVRVLDFAPIESRAAIYVMGATPAGQKILKMNRNGVGEHSYAIEFGKSIHPTVTSGAKLDSMNRLAIQKVSEILDTLAWETPKTMKLFEWVRKNIASTTSDAVYDLRNPFRDPEILAAFWWARAPTDLCQVLTLIGRSNLALSFSCSDCFPPSWPKRVFKLAKK